MKVLLPLLGVVGVAVVLPAALAPRVVSKGPTPLYRAQRLADDERTRQALDSLRRGDATRKAQVRDAIRQLHPNDPSRAAFAELLAENGETRTAYEVLRTRVHFSEGSVSNDLDLAVYVDLAKRTGHPEEAAWAQQRMGIEGHYLVWEQGAESLLRSAKGALVGSPGAYEEQVSSTLATGLRLYPAHRERIEELRSRLLSAP